LAKVVWGSFGRGTPHRNPIYGLLLGKLRNALSVTKSEIGLIVHILGNASGGLYMNRPFSAQIVRHDRHTFLVDCGEGTQMQIFHLGAQITGIAHIFISHLHGDHVLGLMGILSNYSMKQRTAALQVFGPVGLRAFIEQQLNILQIHLTYPLQIQELQTESPEIIVQLDTIQVSTIPLIHRVEAIGYLFTTIAPKLLKIKVNAIAQHNLSIAQIKEAKKGSDIELEDGTILKNENLTYPKAPARSYAYCSDTAYSETVIDVVKGVDLLYHEATFLEEQRALAIKTKHSTALDAAQVAAKAGVKKLLLGHLSGRFADFKLHEAEARTVFSESYGSEVGKKYEV
jgi:ribonuclease Z